ncbi:ABC transporter permease [Dyella sp. 20L07]|uniref:ABC transporter permease n=1 Tax=Dyella sp. 20L07 TaxID=3384240 RepID=UPI003D2B2288
MFDYYLRLAWRRCRQSLPMVALLTLTMALGIASCMTALTIFRALSGDPLPGISPHLYLVTADAREEVDKDNEAYNKPESYLKFDDAKALVDAQRARQQVALAQSYSPLSLPDGTKSKQATGLMAYGALPETLGVQLRYGRSWTQEEMASRVPVMLIDSELANHLFGTADAVGRSVKMGKRSFRVIGVVAPWKPRTQFLDLTRNGGNVLGQGEQFFVPAQAALDADVGPATAGLCGKGAAIVSFQSSSVASCRWIELWVALDTPEEVAAYQQFLDGYMEVQRHAGRFVYAPSAKLFGATAWMTKNNVVPNDVGLNVMLAGSFLLLCLVNVAGLLAARFLRRQAEVAVRRALGASRRQVFAQHLVETGVLGLIGGVLALPLTWLGLWIVRMQPVGYADAAEFSPGAFLILLALSLAVGVVVGILPAWRVCRQPPALQIKLA